MSAIKRCDTCKNRKLYWFGNYICSKQSTIIKSDQVDCPVYDPIEIMNKWDAKKPAEDEYGYLTCPHCGIVWDCDTEWGFRNGDFRFCPLCGKEIDKKGLKGNE